LSMETGLVRYPVPFFFRSEKDFTDLIAADFDLDTVKLLMNLFVESFGGFLSSTRCLFFHTISSGRRQVW
jgi:hypothetical protein